MKLLRAQPPRHGARTRVPEPAEPYEAKELSPAQSEALQGLQSRGIAVTSFRELVADDDLWRELEGASRRTSRGRRSSRQR